MFNSPLNDHCLSTWRYSINGCTGNIVLIDTHYGSGSAGLGLSVLGSNPLGSGTFQYGLSMFSLCLCGVSLGSLSSSHSPQTYIWGKDEMITINSSSVWMWVLLYVTRVMSWWLVWGVLPPIATGRDGGRWINEIDTHSNVSPVGPSTTYNAPARLHCGTSCWLAEWHCCLAIELLWPPGTWHWSTTLIRIGN